MEHVKNVKAFGTAFMPEDIGMYLLMHCGWESHEQPYAYTVGYFVQELEEDRTDSANVDEEGLELLNKIDDYLKLHGAKDNESVIIYWGTHL